jgi:PhnB protein
MRLTPHIYLSFNGQCEAAFKFYEQRLGGKIVGMFTWGTSPDAAQAPAGWDSKIAHASIEIGGVTIMGADMPAVRYEPPKGFQILLAVDEPAAADRAFEALAENGTIQMPMQQTYWSARFGAVTDRFGIPWSINCEQRPASAAE